MSYLRVTEGSASAAALAGLQNASGRLAALQAKMSSGNQITKPSDDPAGTVRAMQLRGSLRRADQYAANAGDGLGFLSTADSAYSSMVTLMQKARTLVVQGLNSGALSSTSMDAIADQVDSVRTTMISMANTTYNGRPIFGGTTAGATAYDAAGNYVGDNGVVSRTVGDAATVQVNQTGPQVFGTPGSDVFALLSSVSSALRSGNTATLTTQLGSIDSSITGLGAAQATQGAAYDRIRQTQQAATTTSTGLKTELSEIQDIDLADMAVRVTTANTTYQAALQTTAAVRQLSLMDFLR
jgi:flagellar hook-associated protein 3 FlgL